jgi:hypothetical protein
MPAGLGETLMKAYVGICQAGVCALAFDRSVIEALVERIKSIAIEIAVVLDQLIFIFVLPFFQ